MLSPPPTIFQGLSLRPMCPEDIDFLALVYAASRADEMALVVNWTDAQKQDFLNNQFNAQHTHYQSHFPNADYDIIVKDGEAIGRLYVDRSETEIRLMDIALLPQYRNQGIGTRLVQDILNEAALSGQWVSLHVESSNPARRLYQRLGFYDVADVTFYKLMHWLPAGSEIDGAGKSQESA